MTASQQPKSTVTTCYVKTSDGLRDRRDAIIRPMEVVREPGSQPEPSLKVQDPFLYYSNDKNRMKELRLQDTSSSSSSSQDDDSASSTTSDDEHHMSSSTLRKTRISFELHPSLLLEDFIMGDELLGDDSLSFDDIIDGWLVDQADKDSGEKDLINSLREVLFLSEE
jgi:hypothetical protein